MIRIIAVLFLVLIVVLSGCKSRPDRMITADGQVLSGELESIDGRHVVFNNAEVSVEYDEGRVFFREGGASFRGYITCDGGKLTIRTDSGDREFSVREIQSVIWSNPADEATVTVDISATDGWVNTGLCVSRNERISIYATGTVSMETGTCGPSGIDYFSTATALVPAATNGQLVMAVGESGPVAAGSTWTGDSPGNGELLLAVNIPNRESTAGVGGTYVVTVIKTAGILNNSVLFPAVK
ncbi:MAG: hypothetical protein K8S24_05840 [Candidatus Aegiribacteria sp.]|nr:hypothetical protein [Candidatus Aegiribacteria sp.]